MRCGNTFYTHYFKSTILLLLEDFGLTLKKCAEITGATPKQVKEIKKEALALRAGDIKHLKR